MTTPNVDEAALLLSFGEMKGTMNALLREQKTLTARFVAYEQAIDQRLQEMDDRVKSLEGYRLKVAGFAVAVTAIFTAAVGPAVEYSLSKLGF